MGSKIEITPWLAIDEDEIQFDFVRASGPGGQNVNKVASGVQLRYNLAASDALPEAVKRRLYALARNRINAEGVLIVEARQHRTQEQNRAAALAKLQEIIAAAAVAPKARRATRPTYAARQKRLESKTRRAATKQLRRPPPES